MSWGRQQIDPGDTPPPPAPATLRIGPSMIPLALRLPHSNPRHPISKQPSVHSLMRQGLVSPRTAHPLSAVCSVRRCPPQEATPAPALPSPGRGRLRQDAPLHQGPEEQEPLLLPPLPSSPPRVTRKSPRFCCQSIFDSSANLTLFSSL